MILTNQIAGFFKLKYRKTQLDFEIDFFFFCMWVEFL